MVFFINFGPLITIFHGLLFKIDWEATTAAVKQIGSESLAKSSQTQRIFQDGIF